MTESKTELQRIAVEDKRRKEEASYTWAVDSQWLDSRMAGARMNRCLALIRREEEMEKDNQEKTDHAAIVNARAEREYALGRAIEDEKKRATEEVARRQFVRENDPELKELAMKLHAGYVCRDRRKQIADNEYKRLQEKVEERYNNCVMQKSMGTDAEAEEELMQAELDRKTAYRTELMKQMNNTRCRLQLQSQEKARDKEKMNEMLQKIRDEDMQALQKKQEKVKELQNEMVTLKRTNEEWREQRRKLAREAEERVQREAAEIASRQSGVEAERERQFQLKEAINRKVAAKVLAEEQARQERAELVLELQQQEQLERDAQLDVAERRKEEGAKRTTEAELTRQMRMKREELRRAKAADVVFRSQNEEKMAEDDEKEREKQRRRKEMMRRYSSDLKQQIVDDQRRKKDDQRELDERNRSALSPEGGWGEVVKEEREKMIAEHAPHVLGYLQAGVLREGDVPALRAGARRHPHLAALDLDSLAAIGRSPLHPKLREY